MNIVTKKKKKKKKSDKEPINFGTDDNPKHIFIASSTLHKNDLIELIKEFKDCYAWDVKDMLGIDLSIAVHKIATFDYIELVKQKLRRLKPEHSLTVKEEVIKLLKNGFIKPIVACRYRAKINKTELFTNNVVSGKYGSIPRRLMYQLPNYSNFDYI